MVRILITLLLGGLCSLKVSAQYPAELQAHKNQAFGYPGLDGNKKIDPRQLPLLSGSSTTFITNLYSITTNTYTTNFYTTNSYTTNVITTNTYTTNVITTNVYYSNAFNTNQFTLINGTNVNFGPTPLATNVNLYGNTTNFGTLYGVSESSVSNLVVDLALKEDKANKAAASGYASLDAGTKVPIAQLPTGSSSSTVAIGNDSRLSDNRAPTLHNVLDSTYHGDVLTGSIARGDLLVGNSTPKIAKFAVGTGFLHGNGTDVDAWRLLAYGDLSGLYNTNIFDVNQFSLTTGTNLHIKDGVLLTNAAFYGRATNNGSAWTVPEGGSGASTLTGILQGNGTSTFTALNGTANYVPKWSSSSPYLTATSRIFDNGANVGIGTALPGVGNTLHIVGSGGENASFRMTAYGADASVDSRMLWQRANGTEAAPSMVSSGDKLRLLFQTYDGVSFKGLAEIRATVDGTPNTNDMPGRLIFATSVAGSGSGAFERLRIDNFGTVGINTTTATNRFEVLDTAGPQMRLTYANASTYTTFQTDVSGNLTVTASGGKAGIGVTPTSTLQVNGAIATPIVTKTTNYTITLTDDMILGDASNSNLVFTLEPLVSGREHTIKRINGGTNTVTIQSTANKNIDGATNYTLTVLYQSITVKADASQWWIK